MVYQNSLVGEGVIYWKNMLHTYDVMVCNYGDDGTFRIYQRLRPRSVQSGAQALAAAYQRYN